MPLEEHHLKTTTYSKLGRKMECINYVRGDWKIINYVSLNAILKCIKNCHQYKPEMIIWLPS